MRLQRLGFVSRLARRARGLLRRKDAMQRPGFLIAVQLMASMAIFSCSIVSPLTAMRPGAASATRTATAPVRRAPTRIPTAASGSGPIFTEKVDLDAFAPPGAGRDLTILNCDYCHSWVCSIRGQRTLDHWVMVEDVHRENWRVLLSDEDWGTLFSYLEENFNDQTPDPPLPSAFNMVGCAQDPLR